MKSTFILSIDGSSVSGKAEQFIRTILDPSNHEIIVSYVVETPTLDKIGEIESLDSVKDQITEEAEFLLTETRERLEDAGFDVKTHIAHGDAGESICTLADEQDADCIILGRTGRSRLEEVLLGSVSDYVIRHASCAVTTVPDSWSSSK